MLFVLWGTCEKLTLSQRRECVRMLFFLYVDAPTNVYGAWK